MRLREFTLPKDQWELLVSNDDKIDASTDLVDLVRTAYTNAPLGSFVKTAKDIVPSDWRVIDWDKDPDIDACVFYRSNRPNENWIGYKIQGMGHDGTKISKNKCLTELQSLLKKNGWWIEASDKLREVLLSLNINVVSNEQFLQSLFKGSNLKMIDDNTYIRVANGMKITESVFGYPKLNK